MRRPSDAWYTGLEHVPRWWSGAPATTTTRDSTHPSTTTTRSSGAARMDTGGTRRTMGTLRYDLTGAARLQVTPKQTQIFVDGYFVGTADKFDGTFQRLRVEAGEHELEFYLDGYRTAKQPVLFRREGTITIKHVMEPVAAGEASERPTPTEPPQTAESAKSCASRRIPRSPRRQNTAPRARPAGRLRNARDSRAARRRPDSDRWRALGRRRKATAV